MFSEDRRGATNVNDKTPPEEQGLEVYLVGGAVREAVLGRPLTERDWVVVGATAEHMSRRGFTLVGRDFPVFLHPRTHEEYALARTERKAGHGYQGFTVYAGPDVTLEQDLIRRDLTINAMARSLEGDIIDPHGGLKDLEARCLRHVSPAFAEDPVRILRVARFAARYRPWDFIVAPETMDLMRTMVNNGEVDHLVPERVWRETHKALEEDHASRYFQVLRQCGALRRWFPEIDRLFDAAQPRRRPSRIDTDPPVMAALDMAARLSPDPLVRFATLVHDLGKGRLSKENPSDHPGHEDAGVPLVDALCTRLKTPTAYRDLGKIASRYHRHVHKVDALTPDTLVDVFSAMDLWRRPQRLTPFLKVCEAVARGCQGLEDRPYPQAQRFREAFETAARVRARDLVEQGYKGVELGHALRMARTEAVRRIHGG